MVGENLHREGISAIEEARAYQTMLDLGVSKADIARQAGQPRNRVLKGLGVVRAGAELGESLQAANLTLDQAAAVASYAEDPEVAAGLIAAAADGDGAFAHAITRAKQDRPVWPSRPSGRTSMNTGERLARIYGFVRVVAVLLVENQ